MSVPETNRVVSQQTSSSAADRGSTVRHALSWLMGALAGSCLALGAGTLVVGVAHGLARWSGLPAAEITITGVVLVCLFGSAMISLRFHREFVELRRTVRHSASYLCEILDRMTWIEGLLEQAQEPDRVSREAVNQR